MSDLSPQRAAGGSDADSHDAATRRLVRTFQRVTTSMYTSADLKQTLQLIADGVIQLVGFRSAVVGIALEDGGIQFVAFNGPPEVRRAMRGARMPPEQWEWRLNTSTRWGNLCWIDHAVVWPDSMSAWIPEPEMVGANEADPDAWHPEDFLFAPLFGPHGTILGVLSVDLPFDGRKPDAAQLELLELFAESAAMAVQHSILLDELQVQHKLSHYRATHDKLTGLANREALSDAADRILAAEPSQVAALVIDLDDFKRVNDEFGHAAGDEVLVAVSQRMRHVLPDDDVLARTGGDEFVVLLSGREACSHVTELVARLIAVIEAPIHGKHGIYSVGASVGAAVGSAPTRLATLLQKADAEMYRSKYSDRRVESRNSTPAA